MMCQTQITETRSCSDKSDSKVHMYVGLILIMLYNEVGCRVPAVPAAGEPGGGGVHSPGHHVRAILELLRCSGSQQPTYLHIVR